MNEDKSHRKIAFYTSRLCYGGLEKNALHFIQWFIEEGFSVTLITNPESDMAIAASSKGITVANPDQTDRYLSLKKTRRLARFLNQENIQALFIIRPRDILFAALYKVFFHRRLRIIYFQQSTLQLKKHPILFSLLFRPFDAWITPSKIIHDKMLSQTRYNPARMLIVPPCIDIQRLGKKSQTKNEARKSLGLPEDKIIIGVLGYYDAKRKHELIIRAIQLLKRHKHNVDLLIMGRSTDDIEEEYFDFLQTLVSECDIENQVHFRPYPETIVTFTSAIDIFVLNWAAEPYDLILQKAMVSGVNVVARFSEMNTELLGNGEYGLLYRADDLQDFTAKIIHLITQPMLSIHLREAARNRVIEKYDRIANCQRIQNLLSKLLED